jgi:hypothetical protein
VRLKTTEQMQIRLMKPAGLSFPINHRSVHRFLIRLDLNDAHEDEGQAYIDAMKQTGQPNPMVPVILGTHAGRKPALHTYSTSREIYSPPTLSRVTKTRRKSLSVRVWRNQINADS